MVQLYCNMLTALLVCVVLIVQPQKSFSYDWRLDSEYDEWSLTGTFIQGTPRQCTAPVPPQNGRWVCSYGFGENGRSLCMIDCKKGHVIENKPTIFNCDKGRWSLFPAKTTPGNDVVVSQFVPHGRCISYKDFAYEQMLIEAVE